VNRPVQLALKRAFDVVVSSITLLLLSPIIGLLALAIKWNDGGPVLYVQERVGLRGQVFRCFKFRTMVVGAEYQGLGLAVAQNDERITRIGYTLRRWSLDEIPQLWNVWRGEMSLVGPRPTVMSQVLRYTPEQRRRLEVKPGMAGWAWIHGRNRLPWPERIALDVWYVEHWSLGLDLSILAQAFVLMLRREGVYGADGVTHDLE
jgi:lipopolysaccharide/colanic/teichoic acid biosynthesis glycosyltransferase